MKRYDLTILAGIGIGAAAIVAGAWLDGLNVAFLWHPTAALIVFGGTFGAVTVRRGFAGVASAVEAIRSLRRARNEAEERTLELAKLAWLARSAQKSGIKVYENHAAASGDPLLARGLAMVADRSGPAEIEQVLLRELNAENDAGLQDAATLEAAGGFAPTFGIIGAVLGLISVLRVLDKPEVLGVGIATAFVATLYGIGVANLLFFPLAARLRGVHESRMRHREEVASVILALASWDTPTAIASRFNIGR